MKRTIARLGVALALATTAVVGFSASPAAATPTGCNWGSEGSFSWAHCTGGTGTYRAWAQCKPSHWWITNWYTSYGSWVSPGTISTASCDGNHTVASYGINYS